MLCTLYPPLVPLNIRLLSLVVDVGYLITPTNGTLKILEKTNSFIFCSLHILFYCHFFITLSPVHLLAISSYMCINFASFDMLSYIVLPYGQPPLVVLVVQI